MRPHTLAEACRRAQADEPFDRAIGDFLQAYYLAPHIDARVPMLADEPPPFEDRRYDALVGGIAEYLYKRWVPAAALDQEPHAHPRPPWWPIGGGDLALMKYLTWLRPPEFASRNIMTEVSLIDLAPLR